MLELFPQGFEEVDLADGIELVAYTDAGGEERLWHVFGGVRGEDVAADWRDRWKAFHQPVRVGPLWIGPPWHEPPPEATPIVIDPGRAFGTGAHPTTQLCVELMLELEPADLVDFGCGSGVLSIVAAKLGFAPVIALDADENAVAATIANAADNGVELDARQANVLDEEAPSVEVAVANITRTSVEALAPRLRSRSLVTSGYLPTDDAALPGFRHLRRITRGGWAADQYEAS
jgi:ribosomal protein L11 methyltransferase